MLSSELSRAVFAPACGELPCGLPSTAALTATSATTTPGAASSRARGLATGARIAMRGGRPAHGEPRRQPPRQSQQQRERHQPLEAVRQVALRERAHPGKRPAGHGGAEAGAERDGGGPYLSPFPCQQHEDEQAGGHRRDRPARERQVDGGAERCDRRRGRGAEADRPTLVRRHPRAEHQPHCGHRPHGVPVGDRLLEPPAGGAALVEVHQAGEEPLGEPIEHHDERARGKRRLDEPVRAEERHARQERAQVEERALGVVDCGARERRPRDRGHRQRREGRQPAEREPAR